MAHKMNEIKGMDETVQTKLAEAQITTTEQLLEHAGTAQQRTPFCDDPTKGVPRRIDTLQGWTRVLAEADGCAPCDDNRPRGPSGPRGDSATGAQHDDASPGTRPASK